MKYIIACLFAIGMFSAAKAQTNPEGSSDQTFICHYVDDQTFQCDLNKSETTAPDKGGVNEEDMSKEPSEGKDVSGKENKSREDRSREEDLGNPENNGSLGTDTSGTGEGKFDQPGDMNKSDSDEGVNEDNSNFQNDPSVDDEKLNQNQDGTKKDSWKDSGTENSLEEDTSVNEGGNDGMTY
ncbi:MAG: hypothetical protein K2X86_01085 [Cytophagaceae bacterium]|nr:hypothetical protein [Cytophagaceae bacterium]